MKLDIYYSANTGVTPKFSILYYAYDVLLNARRKFLAHLLAGGFGRGWPGYTPETWPSPYVVFEGWYLFLAIVAPTKRMPLL
jgi:hypothetical protein